MTQLKLIFVNHDGQAPIIDVTNDTSIRDLKSAIMSENWPENYCHQIDVVDHIRLFSSGKELEDKYNLSDCKLRGISTPQDESTSTLPPVAVHVSVVKNTDRAAGKLFENDYYFPPSMNRAHYELLSRLREELKFQENICSTIDEGLSNNSLYRLTDVNNLKLLVKNSIVPRMTFTEIKHMREVTALPYRKSQMPHLGSPRFKEGKIHPPDPVIIHGPKYCSNELNNTTTLPSILRYTIYDGKSSSMVLHNAIDINVVNSVLKDLPSYGALISTVLYGYVSSSKIYIDNSENMSKKRVLEDIQSHVDSAVISNKKARIEVQEILDDLDF